MPNSAAEPIPVDKSRKRLSRRSWIVLGMILVTGLWIIVIYPQAKRKQAKRWLEAHGYSVSRSIIGIEPEWLDGLYHSLIVSDVRHIDLSLQNTGTTIREWDEIKRNLLVFSELEGLSIEGQSANETEPCHTLPADFLPSFPNLRRLEIEGLSLSDAGGGSNLKLTRLSITGINNTTVNGPRLHHLSWLPVLPENFLKSFPNLRHLHVEGMSLSAAGWSSISELKELRILGLNHTGVSGPRLERLSSLPWLQALILIHEGNIKAEDMWFLVNLKRLIYLNISYTNDQPGQFDQWQSYLPDVLLADETEFVAPNLSDMYLE